MDREMMTQWAMDRVDRLAEDARESANLLRTAERDLAAIKQGRPGEACQRRFYNWKSLQPKSNGEADGSGGYRPASGSTKSSSKEKVQ